MADILKALNDGGFPLMLFIMIYLLWRELVRSRAACEGRIDEMQKQQVLNVTKIATLEGQLQMISHATFDRSFQQASHQQPQNITQTTTER